MKTCVVLTGAGISADSGLKTFRDAGGLWEGHRVQDVATPEGFQANPRLVLDFYNARRRQLQQVKPNAAHFALAELERDGLVYSNRTSGRYVTEDVDMIQQAKKQLAMEQIESFFEKMASMGYDKQETISLIETKCKELN